MDGEIRWDINSEIIMNSFKKLVSIHLISNNVFSDSMVTAVVHRFSAYHIVKPAEET